jgi:hypothetical protein
VTESLTEQLRFGYRTETEASGSAGSVTDCIIITHHPDTTHTTMRRMNTDTAGCAGLADVFQMANAPVTAAGDDCGTAYATSADLCAPYITLEEARKERQEEERNEQRRAKQGR